MILIGLGGNLESPEYGPPVQVLGAALTQLQVAGVRLGACSPWYCSAPVPASDQPWFINGVVRIETALAAQALLALLHRIEERLGRRRGVRWGARIVDLDLLAYDERVIIGCCEDGLVLPHPRLHERLFVLAPLTDLAPSWRHPLSGKTATDMLAALGVGQPLRKIAD
jgi:2-amino-4-hydroxy-6-hydroxymethyldihydropteridine diphosphokinase